jgi:hypothetical protein
MVSIASRRHHDSPLLSIRIGIICFIVGLLIELDLGQFDGTSLLTDSVQPLQDSEPPHSERVPLSSVTSVESKESNTQTSPVGDDGAPRPSWKISLDCSIYSLECPTLRQYEPYPFNFWNNTYTERPVKELNLTEGNLPQSHPESMSQPQPVSKQLEEECLAYAKTTPFGEQLDGLLKKLSRSSNRVAYTMSDIGYAKHMIHDVFAMAHNVVGFPDSFFMVAIDDPTLQLGCRFGYPTIPSPHVGGLENRVKLTKFQVSFELLQRGQDLLFFEMDVWFYRSILPFLHSQYGDMLSSSHQNNPRGMNIGVYSVKANNATRQYFQHCLTVATQYQIHDQLLMQHLETVSNSQKGKWDYLPPMFPNVTFENYIEIELMGAHEIVCSEWPRPTIDTIAIHPLSSMPLMGPHGKMQIAKELGVYYGSNGYYSGRGRYLWLDRLDNTYSMEMNFRHRDWGIWHDIRAMKWTMATMIAIAKRTGRIWVLPRVQADIGRHFLWKMLDMKVVEDMGVQVRETSFLSNRKLSEFPSVGRTAIGEHKMFWQEDNTEPKAWKLDDDAGHLDTWFSFMEGIESNALLVNPHTIDQSWPNRFPTDKHPTPGVELSPVEKDIMLVYRQLKWCNLVCKGQNRNCNMDWTTGFWDKNRLTAASAAHDCYGNGAEPDGT